MNTTYEVYTDAAQRRGRPALAFVVCLEGEEVRADVLRPNRRRKEDNSTKIELEAILLALVSLRWDVLENAVFYTDCQSVWDMVISGKKYENWPQVNLVQRLFKLWNIKFKWICREQNKADNYTA